MPAYTSYSGEQTPRRQLAAAVGFLVLAIALHFLPSDRQQQLASVLRETVLRPFVGMQRNVSALKSRAADPASLRKQLDSLVAVSTTQSVLEEENRRLKRMLQLRAVVGPTWVPATAMRPATEGSESMFLLDIGSEAGVKPYDPVITAQGLVGQIREVLPGRSLGIDWTNTDFRASAMDPQGVELGIVEPRRGAFREEDRMVFNGAAFHGGIEDGTVIVTSGLGGTYPRGIWVGRVDGIAEADAGWRKSYWLRPMVEPGSVTHVLVGTQVDSTTDLTYAFPPDSALTESEFSLRELTREDSLRALGDSVGMLRLLLTATMPLRDSLMGALLSGTMTVPLSPQAAPSSGAAPYGRAGAAGGARQTGAGVGAPALPGTGRVAPASPAASPTTPAGAGRSTPPPLPGATVPGRVGVPAPVTPDTGTRPPRPDTVGARSRS